MPIGSERPAQVHPSRSRAMSDSDDRGPRFASYTVRSPGIRSPYSSPGTTTSRTITSPGSRSFSSSHSARRFAPSPGSRASRRLSNAPRMIRPSLSLRTGAWYSSRSMATRITSPAASDSDSQVPDSTRPSSSSSFGIRTQGRRVPPLRASETRIEATPSSSEGTGASKTALTPRRRRQRRRRPLRARRRRRRPDHRDVDLGPRRCRSRGRGR